jgi:hypothetical protein
MNFDAMEFWFKVAQWLITLALAVSVWLRKPGEDAGKAVAQLRDDVDSQLNPIRTNLATIEVRLKHMPTAEKLSDLDGTVRALAVQVDGLTDSLSAIRNTLNRVENYLLTSK